MIVHAVMAQLRDGVGHDFLAAYSTLERAEAFIDMQEEDLRQCLVVWDVEIDKHPSSGYWAVRESNHHVEALLADLAEIAARIVRESGQPDATATFDARRWVTQWVNEPHPALGGETPMHMIRTPEGIERVRLLLQQQQSGAYA